MFDDSYPLARRDILTLAGLASISPFALDVAQATSRVRRRNRMPAATSSTR